MASIVEWLTSIGLAEYVERFVDSRIDVDILPDLTEADLEKLRIPLGDSKRIIRAIDELKKQSSRDDEQRTSRSPDPADEEVTSTVTEPGQLRHITVCFVDLVGSTALSTALDLEDYNELIRSYHVTCAEVIQAHGGYVAQFAGDGVMAFFGYPRADEDDPEQAVRAGLTILERVARMSDDRLTRLTARIGIASGQSLIGTLNYEGVEAAPSAMGEIPNLAARLQALAEPGMMVVSEATWRLLGTQFVCEDAGRHQLKGFSEPIQVYRVASIRPTASRFEARQRGTATPFVNREAEMDQLSCCWKEAIAGKGNVVLLSGEPGIGKSRLARRVAELASKDVHLRLQFQCSAHHTASALYPVSAHIEHAAKLSPFESPSQKLSKLSQMFAASEEDLHNLPVFARLLGLPVQEKDDWLAALSSQQIREAMVNALAHRVFRLANDRPLLVFFEDLHWIDPSSQELLALMVDQICDYRVLLICTYRHEFEPPWLRLPHVTEIEVNRLDSNESAAIVASLLEESQQHQLSVDAIVEKTDGVPLFIEELTKAAVESRVGVDPGGPNSAHGQQDPLALPSTLKDSLMSRIDRLPQADVVMPIGAAIGRSFSYAILAAVTGIEAAALAPILSRLVNAELLEQRGEPPEAVFSFKHALVQDIAYESVLKSKMRELHTRIGDTIETSFADLSENRPELVAQHFTNADLPVRAVPFWERAAENATSNAANEEAIAHLEAALRENARDPDMADRVRNEIRLREALCVPLEARSWGSEDIVSNLGRLQELVAEHGDDTQLFTIVHGLCGTHLIGGNIELARDDASDLQLIAERSEDKSLAVLSRHALGMSSFFLGAFDQAIGFFDQAIRLRQGVDDAALQKYYVADPEVVGRCMRAWAIALKESKSKKRSLDKAIEQAIEMSETSEHDFTKAYGLSILASVNQTTNNVEGAIDLGLRARELSEQNNFTYWQAWSGIVLGWAAAMAGNPTSGIPQLNEALAIYRKTGSQQIEPYAQALQAEACLEGGRFAEGLAAVKAIDEFSRSHSVRFYDRRIAKIREGLERETVREEAVPHRS